jgi:excinuclease ABC subunit B
MRRRSKMTFNLKSKYKPAGGQPETIKKLIDGYKKKKNVQTLQGITGSGKTFVMANVINELNKPTLVLAHNKILAAQLYQELKQLFPENRVEYFISYYDYYQPESYIPTTDTYIEKEATINEEIEKMRLRAFSSIVTRKDTIVVSSISCIYGAGNPKDYLAIATTVKVGQKIKRAELIKKLIEMQYERNDKALEPSRFRIRGDTIDIIQAFEKNIARIEFFGDEIESITEIEDVTYEKKSQVNELRIFPAKQFVVPEEKQRNSIDKIKAELEERVKELGVLEAARLRQKVKYDLEMLEEVGYCTGIENYSRYFDERIPGQPPYVLLDYFGKDFLLIIDESHQTLPQSRAMYNGDRARKQNLVDFGFRLPSAFDNRPLKFEEFEKYFRNVMFVSATPGDYELEKSSQKVEQIIRPTGLLDPEIEIRPTENQVKDLIKEIKKIKEKDERVLITTLTKRMSEDLTSYLAKAGIKVRYMHSEIESLDRIELVRQLREGEFDVLVGINLLREGLDIPEVSLVAILDADKEGFLRDERSLIQTIGRAARNANGKVILYADNMTKSITNAVKITRDRREKQIEFNKKHGIEPKTINKYIPKKSRDVKGTKHIAKTDREKELIDLEAEMKKCAENLDFEKAIYLRDRIDEMRKELESN